ncbi:hypothetical protein, partial [Salmonella enterica]|uniref:hypothetical protein n=1 Tax=Salmonella enterica TaxID=28901 RepID=UPI003734B502
VQGDPLELHLYARDANRNPVSAAQLDKVNVAIAATGTGVTLTATKTGDDTDATGPYRKYSLVPDTASYATQAIRYNTVTVQVNGANVGTEYHAAWSPDIDLNRIPSAYNSDELRSITLGCSEPLLAVLQGNGEAKVYTSKAAPFDTRCGTDPVTALVPRVHVSNAVEPNTATLSCSVTVGGLGTGWHRGGKIDSSDGAGTYTYSEARPVSIRYTVVGVAESPYAPHPEIKLFRSEPTVCGVAPVNYTSATTNFYVAAGVAKGDTSPTTTVSANKVILTKYIATHSALAGYKLAREGVATFDFDVYKTTTSWGHYSLSSIHAYAQVKYNTRENATLTLIEHGMPETRYEQTGWPQGLYESIMPSGTAEKLGYAIYNPDADVEMNTEHHRDFWNDEFGSNGWASNWTNPHYYWSYIY